MQLAESIRERGVLTPATVQEKKKTEDTSCFPDIQKKTCIQKLWVRIPSGVKWVEMTRDEAVIFMVDSNLQRTKILPSEKAFSYKMRLEAMKRQGKRTDLTSTPLESKLRANEKTGAGSW